MLQNMYGVEMEVPTGKLPGFYAQVIHKIGDQVPLFDRDGQLMIVESEDHLRTLVSILETHGMAGEQFELLLLPSDAIPDDIHDYGFISMSEHAFLYTDRIATFSLDATAGTEANQWAALQQMKEHIIHSLPDVANGTLHLIDKNQVELMEGIARAYAVRLNWELT
ncbi:UNVERIFIED_CONTAM: hypothetical protein ABID98_000689 [Brevibacillus sp. OAP136]|uniref:hypothetical protein n=1 Tax=Brevibacillus fluminis TaxID=511487 RepID=UPI001FE7D584|nr:hypothetical protein [Brevibacillus fluminis]